MAFRLLNQLPQYRKADGTLNAGGSLVFTVTSTTTPKSVFPTRADAAALTNSLGSTITLDADARHSEDVWLASDVGYRVVLKDSDGVTIWTREDVTDAIAGGVTVLAPEDGEDQQVYSTDGTPGGQYWRDVLELPDPSGHSNCYLTSDGDQANWTTIPAEVTYDADNLPGGISSSSASAVIGNVRIQWGSDTAPSASAISTSKAVTFGTPFSGTPYSVQVTPSVAGVTSDSPSAACSSQATSQSSTGFTANFFAGAENNGGNANITSSVTFTWLAVGPA